ncbi:hypothetical protein [Nakamurella panacisegetis]|nr:hypothetical protein [Nakamurella panacisegetis]
MTTTSHIGTFAGTTSVTTPNEVKTVFGAVRTALRHRRAVRAMHAQIVRELSSYTTPNEIAELDAMIERSDVEADPEYATLIERVRSRSI